MRPTVGLASTVVVLALASTACGSSPPSGTAYLVKDINVGSDSSWPLSFTNVGKEVLFRASGGPGRGGLWKTDGTAEGTVFVKEVHDVGSMATVDGSVFFSATDPEHGNELWKSDTTGFGTVLVKDINPGPAGRENLRTFGSSYPRDLTNVNGTLFFVACDEDHGWELWKSDGSSRGTELVKEIYPGPGVRRPDLSVCFDNAVVPPSDLTPLNGVLYFFAEAPESGRELWRSDGTPAGTYLVKETLPGPEPPPVPVLGGSPPRIRELTRVGATLFFVASGLWRSDGTAEGTSRVSTVTASFLTASGSLLFFASGALWRSDGTAAGTVRLSSVHIATSARFDNRISDLRGLDDLLFFDGRLDHGYELWRSDGTPEGTFEVMDIAAGPANSDPASLTPGGVDLLLFTADDRVGSRQLWVSDGSRRGTRRLTSLESGIPRCGGGFISPERCFGLLGDVVLFNGSDPAHGVELWAYRLPHQ